MVPYDLDGSQQLDSVPADQTKSAFNEVIVLSFQNSQGYRREIRFNRFRADQ